jgi:hypothetical protein
MVKKYRYVTYRKKPKVSQRYITKKQKVLKVAKKRVNKTESIKQDKKFKALPAGKRVSRRGKKYWETRSNRSDLKGKNKFI